jgi:hypothetical protein
MGTGYPSEPIGERVAGMFYGLSGVCGSIAITMRRIMSITDIVSILILYP